LSERRVLMSGFAALLTLLFAWGAPSPSTVVDPVLQDRVSPPDTFEVYLQSRGHLSPMVPLRIAADELNTAAHSMVSLTANGRIVALFQSHQIVAILNRSRAGARSFRIELNQGEIDFTADRILPFQSNQVVLYVDDLVSGIVTTNQVRAVVDVDSVVGGGSGWQLIGGS
jgi:hypothetical protein